MSNCLLKSRALSMCLVGCLITGWSINNVYASTNKTSYSVERLMQNQTCKGVVTDKNGEPIIGASVLVKGTTNGTVTNIDGQFSIPNVKKGAVLEVSYLGYVTQNIVWNGQSIKVTLKEDSKALDEVVVVGYGTQKKVNVTGAVSSVDSKALEARPVQNVTQALQGQVPGLNMSVGNGGGALNSNLGINIRGAGTIGEGSKGAPLVLIDGIEGSLNSVNPNDIANISVLKDAASSSIYGARAAFGVILITTKKGKEGKANVSYSGNVRFATAIQRPEMLGSLEFAKYFNDAKKNQDGGHIFTDEVIEKMHKYVDGCYTDPNTPEYYGTEANPEGLAKLYNGAFANTDWFHQYYKDNVPSQEHNLSISGGNDKITYLLSGSFLDQNGLLRFGKDKFQRYTLNGRFSAKLTNWMTLNYISKWTREDYTRPQYLEIGGLFFHNIARRWPNNPVKQSADHYIRNMEIYELLDGGIQDNQKNWITNQVQLILEPIKDWHIRLDGNLRQSYNRSHRDVLPMFQYKLDGTPYLSAVGWDAIGFSSASDGTGSEDYFSVNAITDYSKQLGKHYFKVMAGFNAELYNGYWLNGSGTNLITPSVPEVNTTQKDFKASNGKSQLALAGFFGRINYNYGERYLLEANFRYDGSSRFIGDKRWGFFPSFSAGWNIAREAFFDNASKYVTTLKLRGSWGQLGNNETESYYPFYMYMPVGKENSAWLVNNKKLNTAGMPGIVSDLLTWETVESWDLGADFGFFDNRLTGSFDYFQRFTYDMVGPAPTLPAILGTGAPKVNNADLKSYGWEMELQWRDKVKDFNYGVKLNLSDSQREILKYPNEIGNIYKYYDGKIIGELWGYESVGLANSLEEMNAHLENNKPDWGANWNAGDVMYKDLNGDKKINSGANTLKDHGDLVRIGNSTPRYNFGIMADASWKGFDFSIFMQGVMKRDYLFGEGDPYFWGIVGNEWQSAGFKSHLDYWTPEHHNAYFPRPIFGEGGKNQKAQKRYMQNAAYMRIKNVQLGYTLPQALTQKAYMNKLRFYVSVDNLATFTGISKTYDPEALGGAWGSGKLYPLQRTVSLGVNINF